MITSDSFKTGRLGSYLRVAVKGVVNTSSMLMALMSRRPARLAGLPTHGPVSLEVSKPLRLLTMASAFLMMIRMCDIPKYPTQSKYI